MFKKYVELFKKDTPDKDVLEDNYKNSYDEFLKHISMTDDKTIFLLNELLEDRDKLNAYDTSK